MSTDFKDFKGKIILHGCLTAHEGHGDKIQALLKNIQAEAITDKEPGCLTYRVNRSGNEFLVFEEYQDVAAITAHFDKAGFKKLVEEVKKGDSVAKGPEITYYEEV
ncbi:hypothetical protein FRC09_006472 [Ceratobasidium sp. 395]|nr:hypothetical protein FRC09_006472 [Ceratobasidium sp. 395]